jgi:hypothetical protein
MTLPAGLPPADKLVLLSGNCIASASMAIGWPILASRLLARSASQAEGFAWSLGVASTSLAIGAGLYAIMWLCWPITAGRKNVRSKTA